MIYYCSSIGMNFMLQLGCMIILIESMNLIERHHKQPVIDKIINHIQNIDQGLFISGCWKGLMKGIVDSLDLSG